MSITSMLVSKEIKGKCNCGDITITIRQSETIPRVSLCHCSDCRASGGTLFAVNILVAPSNLVIGGSQVPNVYRATASSGNQANRHFCPRCGSPIMTTVTENPDTVFVKGGLFRDAGIDLPQPIKEQWWRRAEKWERPYVSSDKLVQ